MTNQSRVQPAPASTALVAASMTPIYMAMPFMVLVPTFQMSSTMVMPISVAAPAPPADTKVVPPADAKVRKEADPLVAARTPLEAGLPATLVALLRSEDGPFLANEVFSIAPSQPLTAVPEDTPTPKWYAVSHHFVIALEWRYEAETASTNRDSTFPIRRLHTGNFTPHNTKFRYTHFQT
ncbi:hypothetical protein B0H13DRAFT_1913011 [Mycena leptocephala]|nr:hypothetical protein B0H13DRAFT_1913011 [Mycena leptocephala]